MFDIARLSDDELTRRLHLLVAIENRCLAAVLEHIAEFDKRRLHGPKGQPSCFVYCTKVLGYSEGAAYKRITAARWSRDYPAILARIHSGQITLRAVLMLGPHLTGENHARLLGMAEGKTRLEIERMVAQLAPQQEKGDHIQHLPHQGMPGVEMLSALNPMGAQTSEPQGPTAVSIDPFHGRQSIHPTAPERVRFAFTGSEHLLNLLRRAQELLRHKYPAGDLEKIFAEVLEAFLDRRDPERRLRVLIKEEKAQSREPRAARPQSVWAFASRYIPQAVRDAVWRRDGGQCVYRTEAGERCPERGGLEFDHVVPFALGGASNNPKNIRLLCKTHNLMLARLVFGEAAMRRSSDSSEKC